MIGPMSCCLIHRWHEFFAIRIKAMETSFSNFRSYIVRRKCLDSFLNRVNKCSLRRISANFLELCSDEVRPFASGVQLWVLLKSERFQVRFSFSSSC